MSCIGILDAAPEVHEHRAKTALLPLAILDSTPWQPVFSEYVASFWKIFRLIEYNVIRLPASCPFRYFCRVNFLPVLPNFPEIYKIDIKDVSLTILIILSGASFLEGIPNPCCLYWLLNWKE